MKLQGQATKSSHGSRVLTHAVASFAGMAMSSLCFHMYLWSQFMQTQPRTPNPAAGLTYAMNNHGWHYYLSAAQSTQLSLAFYLFLGFFALAAILAGPQLHSRLRAYRSFPGSWLASFCAAFVIWCIALGSYSYRLANAMAARGFALSP